MFYIFFNFLLKIKLLFGIIYLFFLLFCCITVGFAQNKASGTIKSVEYPYDAYNKEYPPNINFLDMGMCMPGDSLQLNFELLNTGIKEISLAYKKPSFSLESYDGLLDFELLKDNLNKVGKLLNSNDKFNIRITYNTENTINDPISKNKFAKVLIGLFDSDSVPIIEELKESDLLTYKWYVLKFRKTNKVLDGFENYKFLDSVYVNPTDTLWYNWTVQNSSNRGLTVEAQDTNWLTPRQQDASPEFFFDFYNSNLNFPQNRKFSRADWKIGYYPVNPGEDIIEVALKYRPDPVNFPDSIDFVRDTVRGFGVIQKLSINYDDCINVDSIFKGFLSNGKETIIFDIGKILRNEIRHFQISLKNSGNILYGSKGVRILNENDDSESDYFKIEDGSKFDRTNIGENQDRNIVDSFVAANVGVYKARLIFDSDIASRGIRGFPSDARETVFLLKAEVVEPKIKITSESVDFGNVVLCPENPAIIIDSFKVFNDGKAQLQIDRMYIEPGNTPFSIVPGNMSVPPGPNTFGTAYISLNTSGLEVNRDYNAKLVIENNSFPPYNRYELNIKARITEPGPSQIGISKALKAKPGTIFNVPLIVDKMLIGTARTFRDTLSFDGNLLEYVGFIKTGTAAEDAVETDIKIAEKPMGVLSVDLKMPEKVYFNPSDTLINLIFKSYLGSKISTDITFRNPEFGNGICARVLNLSSINGLFSLDSVCGLEQKAVPGLLKKFNIMNIIPNPASDNLSINFKIDEFTKLEVNLYDLYGQKILNPESGAYGKGEYSCNVNLSSFAPGVYYAELSDGYFYEIFRIVVAR